MLRNRDLLLAYLRHRMIKIEEHSWEVAGEMSSDSAELLSVHEREYAQRFNGLLSTLQTAYDVDLTRDLEPPTDSLYIKVNVLVDVGQIVGPESGADIDLRKGDQSYLRRGDVEHLIRKGDVEHVL